MLREYETIQDGGDHIRKRWFSDEEFDLLLYFNETYELIKFRLIYGKDSSPFVIEWSKRNSRVLHKKFNSGESTPGKIKQIPIESPTNEKFDSNVLDKFIQAASELNTSLINDVSDRIRQFMTQ